MDIEERYKNIFITSDAFLNMDIDGLSGEEYREHISNIEKHNAEIYRKKSMELRSFKDRQREAKIEPEEKIKKEEFIECIEISQEKEEKTDITFYWNLLKSCKNGKDLVHALPRPSNTQYNLLMNLILAECLKEMKEIEEFLQEEQLTEEDRLEFLNELKEKRSRFAKILEYRDHKEELESEVEEQENQLIYLESVHGNTYALNDIKKIDVQFYDAFLELLESIQNGTFKNMKTFQNNQKLNGLLEVKGFHERIVFKRMSENIYAIIDIFVKKDTYDGGYAIHLKTRAEKFWSQCEKLKRMANNQEYLEEQSKITEEIKRVLRKGDA